MILMIYLLNLLFYISICGFFMNYYYYLKSLIMVEFIMTSVMLIFLFSIFGSTDYIIYILILGVCEGILGLLMVVLMYRIWGTDGFMLVDYNFW